MFIPVSLEYPIGKQEFNFLRRVTSLDKFFKISERGSNVRTEIIAGLTTFFAMAYIVVTNPNQIVSFNNGPDADPAFQQIWNAVYVASILAAVIGTLLMAFYAKMPFAQACGMGLNSFFFVSFILPEIITGGDVIKGYHAGLVIILVSGIIFMIFSLTGLRTKVAKALPDCLKKAIPAGIGLFIAFIGSRMSASSRRISTRSCSSSTSTARFRTALISAM